MSGYTRRPSFLSAMTARRRAEAAMAVGDLPASEGLKTINLVEADGLAAFGRRHGRRTMARFLRLQSRTNRLDAVMARRSHADDTARKAWAQGFESGANPMAPGLWLVAVVLVFSIDLALGRYLLAKAAPDDGDLLVFVSSLGVAMWVFATSHLAGHLIDDAVSATGFADRHWWRRRWLMAGGFVGLYGGFVVWVLAVTNAGAGRWAIAFVPLVAGSLIQSQRPDSAVWHWFGARVRLFQLTIVANRRLRRCERAATRFVVDLTRARTFWLHQASLRHSVEGQWGLGQPTPSVELVESELARLDTIGVMPDAGDVEELLGRLADHGRDYSHDRWAADQGISTRRSLASVENYVGPRSN